MALRPSRPLRVLLIAALATTACRKTDAERAAAERAGFQEQLRSSYALVPYRFLKLAVRAEGAPNAPEELGKVLEEARRIGDLTQQDRVRSDAEAVLRLAALAYQTRSLLARHDEDEYPTLWSRFSAEPPPPWYDAGAEHLSVAFVEGLVNLASGGKDGSLATFAAYELSRAEPSPAWPAPERAAARLERGVLFCANGRHYAAEEELDAYLRALDGPAAAALLVFVRGQQDPFLTLRGVGRLVRGYNRLQLGRDEPALADLEAGLRDLEAGGVENEGTLWMWALLHARRGRPAEAAASLERLSGSPFLEPEARGEIERSAASLRSSSGKPDTLLQARALVLVGRALLARAGGAEAVLARVAGPEAARRVVAPAASLVELQAKVVRASDPARLAGEARGLGSSLLARARRALGLAPPQP